MKVLVVGGAGYIGGAVTDALESMQIPFTVYDDLVYEPHYLKPVEFVRGDIRNLKAEFINKFTHIIWLAAIVGDGACEVNPELTQAINADSVKWLVENFEGRIIFTSTCSVYGAQDNEITEDGATAPLSRYASSKLEAEGHLLKHSNALIFRLGTAFGISDTYSRPRMDLVANQMPVAALTQDTITLHGGDQWRPMIHTWDIAASIVFALRRNVKGIYNLATVNLQMKELAETCSELTGCWIKRVPMAGDRRNYHVSTAKATAEDIIVLPSHPISFGVMQFISLMRSGRVTNAGDSRYFNVKHLEEQHGANHN